MAPPSFKPELFVEISPELPRERHRQHGLDHGLDAAGPYPRQGPRDAADALAFTIDGRTVHHVGMPFHWGYQGLSTGDAGNELTSLVGDPNVSITRERPSLQTWRRRDGGADGLLSPIRRCASGAKACEVACKRNEISSRRRTAVAARLRGQLRQHAAADGIHWRHVKFIEQFSPDRSQGRWLMMSDVCKHCVRAGCLEVCPTGAIIRTEFDTVVIQSDMCNGCRDCIGACPFGVIGVNPVSGTARSARSATTG